MFGKGQRTADESAVTLQPGINTGFKSSGFFIPVQGENWTAWDFIFEGPITVKDRLFLPKKVTEPTEYDKEKGIVAFNKRREKKGEKEATMEEYLQNQYERKLQDFDRTLRMYAFTFYPDGSNERDKADQSLPEIKSVEEFIDNLDSYIEILKGLLPKTYENQSYDLILGKKSGGQYLEFPDAIWRTGRYVKLSADGSRELKLTDSFKSKYMMGSVPSAPGMPPVATPQATNWNI